VGKEKWQPAVILSILQNEKYEGHALLQKGYTEDFHTKKRRKNHGEVQQYWVENSHPAIVSPETFDLVQAELKRRSACVDDNARRKQDQNEYKVRYQGLVDRFETAKVRHGELTEQIQDRKVRKRAAECFQREVMKRKAPLEEFDEQFWYATADFITVYHDGRVVFTFKDGTEVST
jgi:hypothetical protein